MKIINNVAALPSFVEPIRKRLIIAGVAHISDHPSYQATLDWVNKNVKPGMRVGLEGIQYEDPYLHDEWLEEQQGGKIILPKHLRGSESPLKVVSFETGRYIPREMFEFVEAVRKAIEAKGAEAVPIESEMALQKSVHYDKLAREQALEAHDKYHEIEHRMLEQVFSPYGSRGGLYVPNRSILTPAGFVLSGDGKRVLDELRAEHEKLKEKARQTQRKGYVVDVLRSKTMLKNALPLDAAIMGGAHADDIRDYAGHIRAKRIIFLGFENPKPVMGGAKMAREMGFDSTFVRRLKESFKTVR
ncbi:hypothetical protein HYV43_04625 [Candidatus Micrarchaeota archaeon]|nr:hypothetical protein [Candidatus Micrarchaeota archaeon]